MNWLQTTLRTIILREVRRLMAVYWLDGRPVALRVEWGWRTRGEAIEYEDGTLEICLTVGPDLTRGYLRTIVIHELTHLSGWWGHDRAFREAFAALAGLRWDEARARRTQGYLPKDHERDTEEALTDYANGCVEDSLWGLDWSRRCDRWLSWLTGK
jgi:hypothetical protein